MALMQKQPPFIVRPVRVARAYEELASMIRQRIVSGELGEGDRIPSESALAKEAQVSRSTVREALRTLEESGLIERTSPKIMVVRRPSEERAYRELHRALRRRNVTFHHLHEALLVLDPSSRGWPRRGPTRPASPSSRSTSRRRRPASATGPSGIAWTRSSTSPSPR